MVQAGLEGLDVVRHREELEDLDALALGVAVELAVLGKVPFSLPEHAATPVSPAFFFPLLSFLATASMQPDILDTARRTEQEASGEITTHQMRCWVPMAVARPAAEVGCW